MTEEERAIALWKHLDEAYNFQIKGSGTLTTDGVKWILSEIEEAREEGAASMRERINQIAIYHSGPSSQLVDKINALPLKP